MEERNALVVRGPLGMQPRERLSRRGFLKAGAIALIPVLLSDAKAPWLDPERPPILWHGSRSLPLLAITIDDCFSLAAMQRLNEILPTRAELKVTFFPTGRALLNTSGRDANLWPSLKDQGHEFGYHGYDHEMPGRMSAAQLQEDYARWGTTLTDVMGEELPIRFARPPYGNASLSFQEFCEAERLTVAMWSASWGGARATALRQAETTRAGDIVLMHARSTDVENLEPALEVIADFRLCKVTLSNLQSGCDGMSPEAEGDKCDCGDEAEGPRRPSRLSPENP